jgi:integrase
MVHFDLVCDGKIGAGIADAELVEVVAEPMEGAAVKGVVGRVDDDLDAMAAGAHLAGQLEEGAEESARVVGVGVVDEEAFEEPLLGVVGGELDAVDDRLLLQARLLTPAEAGQGDLLGYGLAAGDQVLDLGLELARLGPERVAAAVVNMTHGQAELGVDVGQVPARKPSLRDGYAPSTINHALSVVSGFYAFHSHLGRGPTVNPVPVSAERRRALAHRSPLEPVRMVRRARLRQKLPAAGPRAIPDRLWDELFGAMSNDRDRALLAMFVSSGARAGELLGLRLRDVDWARQLIYVVSKGTGALEPVPASPEAFRFLGRYLDQAGVPRSDDLVWRTRWGATRPLTYSALRRTLQRANEKLGTNWSLHDLRHTAASRMATDPAMTLPEVQTILRHAH